MKKVLSLIFFSALCTTLSEYAGIKRVCYLASKHLMPLCTPTNLRTGTLNVPAQRSLNRNSSKLFVAEVITRKHYIFSNKSDALTIIAEAQEKNADEINWYEDTKEVVE